MGWSRFLLNRGCQDWGKNEKTKSEVRSQKSGGRSQEAGGSGQGSRARCHVPGVVTLVSGISGNLSNLRYLKNP